MSNTQTAIGTTNGLSEAVRASQEQMARISRNYECFLKGLMDVGARQAEFVRDMIEGNVEDFNRLAGVRTPEALVQAELDIFRRRSEQVMAGTTRIGEAMQRMCAEAAQSMRAA